MNPERWRQIDQLLDAALERAPEERGDFLAAACAGDEELRREVESLLRADEDAGGAIDQTAAALATKVMLRKQSRSLLDQLPEQYKALSPLGTGGMGEVWLAEDTRLGRRIALKLLPERFTWDPARVKRFEQEGRAASALNHPNIITIFDIGRAGRSFFIAAEYVEGWTLRRRIVEGALSVPESLGIARQIASAIAAAHAAGIVHRDIKPENVMIRPDGLVKVLDFGLAKLMEARTGDDVSNDGERLTQSGLVLGTAGYMSPEQVRGHEADHRSDIFSTGILLYEMLSGQRAFRGDSAIEVMNAILKDDPPSLNESNVKILPALDRIVRRCLEKSPERRFQSAADLGFALEGLASGSAAPLASWAETETKARARRIFTPSRALGAALFAAALLLLAAWLRRAPAERALFYSSLPLPEQTTSPVYGGVAIAPDGRNVAVVAVLGGVSRLWLYSFDKPGATLLPGTDGARYPFWAPNSRSIGFFAQGKLKRIELSGGQPVALSNAPQGYGGTWSRLGVILFSPNTTVRGLHRISETGGLAEPVTRLDVARSEIGHWHPYFLPDGRHFVFFAYTGNPAYRGIRLGSLDGKITDLFLPANSKAEYASNGYLLFVRGRKILAQPFDPEKLATRGEPTAITERVEFDPTTCQAELSVFGDGLLVYRSGGNLDGQLSWIDRKGTRLGTAGPPGEFRYVKLSADGARALLERNDPETESNDIWQIDLRRETLSRVTSTPFGEWCPLWAPDAGRVIFTSMLDRFHCFYQKGLEGGPAEELLVGENGKVIITSDWSRDGRHLVYRDDGEETGRDISLLPMTGNRSPAPYLATPFDEYWANISPDSRWLAYQSTESGRYEIYVQSFPAPGTKTMISKGGGAFPRWRSDGRELYYISADDKLMAVPLSSGKSVRPGAPVPLFEVGSLSRRYNRYVYDVSADGQRFLVIVPQEDASGRPLTIVQNWTTLVR